MAAVLSARMPATVRSASFPQMLPLRLFKLFFYTGKRSQLGDVLDCRNYEFGRMRRGNVQYWHNVHNEAPFFVPEEAHEEDEEKSWLEECPDASVLYKTNRDEQLGRHKKREERPTSSKSRTEIPEQDEMAQ